MKSVKRVLKNSFQPRYNLRSRKTVSSIVKTSTPKVDSSVQADLSEGENCEFLRELAFRPYTDQVLPPPPSVPGCRESHPEEPSRVSTAFSSPDPGNSTNRDPIDISIDPNEGPSIVHPNLPDPPFSRVPTAGNESSSLEDFTPINSRRLQSGPHIALEVENIRDPDNEGPNLRREASAAWKTSPLINSQASVRDQVPVSINHRRSKQNKQGTRSESISSADLTESENEREDSEDSEDEENRNKNEENRIEKENEEDPPSISKSMETETLRELQEQMVMTPKM